VLKNKAASGNMQPPLTLQEKELYNQIHPAKLAVDIGSTPFSLYLFWQHELLPAILVAFIPAIIASAIIMKYVDLEPYRLSSLGRYVNKYMTRAMEGIRSLGFIVMIAGAWFHIWLLLPAGLLMVLLGWLNGVFAKWLTRV
jgi:hypothetical protein